MFVCKKKYEAALADAQRERETAGRLLGKNVALRSEVAALSAELATLKAKRARSTANLIPGGAKKKAQVLAERAGSVG